MLKRYFIITVAIVGALIVGLASSARWLGSHPDGVTAAYQVAEASDDAAEGEEETDYC